MQDIQIGEKYLYRGSLVTVSGTLLFGSLIQIHWTDWEGFHEETVFPKELQAIK